MFQSPSLRGSGLFAISKAVPTLDAPRFNPLHCGAVVSSSRRSRRRRRSRGSRFNPLHCGAVVSSEIEARRKAEERAEFQSPSLRGSGLFATQSVAPRSSDRFNPLHCGAVVSSEAEARARKDAEGFNPLHCGAVVSSSPEGGRAIRLHFVSIPFIAGQWSLPRGRTPKGARRACFNPLHCGAVVSSCYVWLLRWRCT